MSIEEVDEIHTPKIEIETLKKTLGELRSQMKLITTPRIVSVQEDLITEEDAEEVEEGKLARLKACHQSVNQDQQLPILQLPRRTQIILLLATEIVVLAATETAAQVVTEIAVLVYTIMIEKEIEVVDENRIQNMESEIMILRV